MIVVKHVLAMLVVQDSHAHMSVINVVEMQGILPGSSGGLGAATGHQASRRLLILPPLRCCESAGAAGHSVGTIGAR